MVSAAMLMAGGKKERAGKKGTPSSKSHGMLQEYPGIAGTTMKIYGAGDPDMAELMERPHWKLYRETYDVNVEWVGSTHQEWYSKLAVLVASNESPDFCILRGGDYFPTMITMGLAEEVEDLINWDSPLWKGTEPEFDLYAFGQPYIAVPLSVAVAQAMFFNKEMFENAGELNPMELYKRGEWTLDKVKELALKFTEIDDWGVPITQGLATLHGEVFLELYGKHIVWYEDGKFVNNSYDPDVVKMYTWAKELIDRKALRFWGLSQFNKGKVAMVAWHPWFGWNDARGVAEAGNLGYAPYPKLTKDSPQIISVGHELAGIIKGSKNIPAALAAIDCWRYVNTDQYKDEHNVKFDPATDERAREEVPFIYDDLVAMQEWDTTLPAENPDNYEFVASLFYETLFNMRNHLGNVTSAALDMIQYIEELQPQINARVQYLNGEISIEEYNAAMEK